jgi:hypothetical protein
MAENPLFDDRFRYFVAFLTLLRILILSMAAPLIHPLGEYRNHPNIS